MKRSARLHVPLTRVWMEEAFLSKMIKYQPLLNIISELGYQS